VRKPPIRSSCASADASRRSSSASRYSTSFGQQERHVVEWQAELAQEDLARERLAEGGEEVDRPVGRERVEQLLGQLADDRLERRHLLGREQRVEQLAVSGVLLTVEHQRDQWSAGAQREGHDGRGVGIDRVDVAPLGHGHHVVEAGEFHGVAVPGHARPGVDGGEPLVGVDDAFDERLRPAVVRVRVHLLRHGAPSHSAAGRRGPCRSGAPKVR
jgi:hypothetical protein